MMPALSAASYALRRLVVSRLVEVDFTANPQFGLFPKAVIMREIPVEARSCRQHTAPGTALRSRGFLAGGVAAAGPFTCD